MKSLFGTKGAISYFEAGLITAIQGKFEAVPIFGNKLKLYQSIGGVAGNLGFPLTPNHNLSSDCSVQEFEGGAIFQINNKKVILVPLNIWKLFKVGGGFEKLGYPVSEAIVSGKTATQAFSKQVISIP